MFGWVFAVPQDSAVKVDHVDFAPTIAMMLENGNVALAKVHILNLPQIESQYGELVATKLTRRVERMLTHLGGEYLFTQVSNSLFGVACGRRESAEVLEEEIQLGLRAINQVEEFPFLVNLGFGLVFADQAEHLSAIEWVERANIALLESSRTHQGVIYRHESEQRLFLRRLFGRLSHASSAPAGMTWVYQPIVELASKERFGYEALCRWTIEEFGPMSPDTFIPLAEETGAIVHLDRWALLHAIDRLDRLRLSGSEMVTVNVSPMTLLADTVFIDTLRVAIEADSELASAIVIELTESLIGRDVELILEQIRVVRSLGVRVAVDDFGTGETSLSAISTISCDFLKIDQGIIRHPDERLRSGLLDISARFAQLLGAEVIVEGIETAEQHEVALRSGARYGQGWYLGMPIAID